MGTDIHMRCERKDENGKWNKVGKFRSRYYDPDDNSEYKMPEYTDLVYQGRNYDLFAILANVRNGYGFAGVPTGEGFEVIAEPRGVPNDMSEELQAIYDADGEWTHDHSYLTLKEILDWPYWIEGETAHLGVVGIESYKEYKETGAPDGWCNGVSGGGVEKVSNAVMDKIVAGEMEKDPDKSYYTDISWREGYMDCTEDFWHNTIPILKSLDPDPANVRIIFWFDS